MVKLIYWLFATVLIAGGLYTLRDDSSSPYPGVEIVSVVSVVPCKKVVETQIVGSKTWVRLRDMMPGETAETYDMYEYPVKKSVLQRAIVISEHIPVTGCPSPSR